MITLLLLLLRPMLLLAAAWHGGMHRNWLNRSGTMCRRGKHHGGAGQRRRRRRLAGLQPTCQRILQRICCRWLLLLLLLPAESLEHGVRGLLALSAARLAAAARASKGCGPKASARRPDWPAEAQAQPARSCNLLHGCVDPVVWQLRLAVLRERRWAGKQPPERPMQAACWRPPIRGWPPRRCGPFLAVCRPQHKLGGAAAGFQPTAGSEQLAEGSQRAHSVLQCAPQLASKILQRSGLPQAPRRR